LYSKESAPREPPPPTGSPPLQPEESCHEQVAARSAPLPFRPGRPFRQEAAETRAAAALAAGADPQGQRPAHAGGPGHHGVDALLPGRGHPPHVGGPPQRPLAAAADPPRTGGAVRRAVRRPGPDGHRRALVAAGRSYWPLLPACFCCHARASSREIKYL